MSSIYLYRHVKPESVTVRCVYRDKLLSEKVGAERRITDLEAREEDLQQLVRQVSEDFQKVNAHLCTRRRKTWNASKTRILLTKDFKVSQMRTGFLSSQSFCLSKSPLDGSLGIHCSLNWKSWIIIILINIAASSDRRGPSRLAQQFLFQQPVLACGCFYAASLNIRVKFKLPLTNVFVKFICLK